MNVCNTSCFNVSINTDFLSSAVFSCVHVHTQRAKFEEKAKLIEGGLTELIDTPLTTLGGGDRSRVEGFVSTSDEMKEMIETSLRKVETKKKREQKRAQKLSEELKKIREENMELRNRCNDLERQAKEQVRQTPLGISYLGTMSGCCCYCYFFC